MGNPSLMKETLRQITPPIVGDLARRVYLSLPLYSSLRRRRARDDRKRLEIAYRTLNEGLGSDTMMLRPNLEVRIHPDSRNPFERFCIVPSLVDEMNCFLEATKKKERLLDIGALHGIFSIVFAIQSPSRTVLSIDASPIAFARLLYNIHKNELSNIVPVECAVSEKAGVLSMHYEWEHAVAAGTDSTNKQLDVEMDTCDNLCDSRAFDPDVIKIDVEGHEIKVLKGLSEIIRRCSPLIFLEIHPRRIAEEGDDINFLEEFFGGLGYTASWVSGGNFPLSSFAILSGKNDHLVLKRGAEQGGAGNGDKRPVTS